MNRFLHFLSRGKLIWLNLFLLFFTTVSAQTVVAGYVYDVSDSPLPGVSILLKGANGVGTVTGIDGEFSLKIEQELPVTLSFNSIGFKNQEVDVYDASQALVIHLKENTQLLNEVVVTALGISRAKKSLGYTTQELKAETIGRAKESNLLNALSGKVAGVRITNSQGDMGSSRIVIRGETSIAGNNQPLFVVDGVPVDNSQLNKGGNTRDFRNAIADLNPEDIESMNILKGPNAAALYGSRAAHGVILITTKSGKGQKGLGISVNTGVTFSKVATLPDFQDVFGQGADGLFSYVDGKGGGLNDGVDESWGPRMDGRLIPQFDSPVVDGVRQATPFLPHPDNVSSFFRTGVTYDNSVAVSGSDERYDFRLGANNQLQKGTVPNTEINKTNFTLNANYQLTKWLKVGGNVNYIITDVPNLPGGPSGNRAAGVMLQYLWFGRQVSDASLREDWARNWNDSYYSNPYWRAHYNTTSQKRNRLIGNINLEAQITEELNFRFRTGTDYYNDRRKYKIKYGTSGTPFGSYAEDAYTVSENNTEAILHYTKTLNEDFSFDVLGGFNVRNRTFENNIQKAPRLAVPDLYTLTNSRDPLESSNEYSRLRIYSGYASAQLGYKGFAFLNLTGRNDWSSTLPRDNRSFFYPSVSASLIVTEALGINSNVLDFLKIRGGWSEVGNDASPYQLATVYNFETAFEGNPILTSSKKKLNENLKPETTRSFEVGLEFALLDNRIHLDAAYYNTNSIDQILEVKTSAASGYTSQLLNAGKINNQGVELQATLRPVRTTDFEWILGLNYAKNRSKVKVLDYEGKIKSYTIGSSGGVEILASVGDKYGALFGTAYERDTNGNILVGDNGLPKADPEKKVLGHFQPDWLGGLNNTFTYKNVELSFLIDASFGGKIYSGTNRTGVYTGVLESTLPGRGKEFGGLDYYYPDNDTRQGKVLLTGAAPANTTVYDDGMIFDGVTADGEKNTKVVSAREYYQSTYNIHEAFVYDASYVKFREIRLGYNLSDKFLKKIGLEGASIAFVGRNLFFIYKDAPNIDPEVALSTGNGQGVESLSLPTTRSFGFNLSLKF